MADGIVLTRQESGRGVHETAQRAPRPVNRGVVRDYVGYEEWTRQEFLRPETARPGVALIMAVGDPMVVYERDAGSPARIMGAFVVGNQSRPSVTGVGGHQLGVQVELTPAGARGLFGDVEDLSDAVVPLDEALGARGDRLVERLAEMPSWGARLEMLDDALATVRPRHLSPEVAWLHRQLLASKGRPRVEPLMDETGWSRRHVTERFRRQLGVSPKAYARLLRFEHAASLLRAGKGRCLSLAETAAVAGYYDQSHLTRDFVALAGTTPGAYAAGALVPEVSFVQDDEATRPAAW